MQYERLVSSSISNMLQQGMLVHPSVQDIVEKFNKTVDLFVP